MRRIIAAVTLRALDNHFARMCVQELLSWRTPERSIAENLDFLLSRPRLKVLKTFISAVQPACRLSR